MWRDRKGEDFKAYLAAQDSQLDKFDENLFRRLIEKVKVQSMLEVVFVLKSGVEVTAVL
ncbi:MAG: integrase [Desulfosporosinus sp.]|nr:integrase [Desulfosporosinus sp.]